MLGRFYLGVAPTGDGYRTFTVEPDLGGLQWIKGTVPVPGGLVRVSVTTEVVEILSDIPGGILKLGDKTFDIPVGKIFAVSVPVAPEL